MYTNNTLKQLFFPCVLFGTLAGCSSAGNSSAAIGASASSPTKWPYGATISNASFAGPGTLTVHVDALHSNAIDEGAQAGAALTPFKTFGAAMKHVEETLRATNYSSDEVQGTPSAAAEMVWMKLVRRGDKVSGFVAEDNNGQPGQWKNAGGEYSVPLGKNALAGIQVRTFNPWTDPANATFDHLTIDGKPVAFSSLEARPIGEESNGKIEQKNGAWQVEGRAGYPDWSRRSYYDAGFFAFVPMKGDGEVQVRVKSLVPNNNKQGAATLFLRSGMTAGAFMTEIRFHKDGPIRRETRTAREGKNTSRPKAVRVMVKPGTYRLNESVNLESVDEISRETPLLIEGDATGGKGRVILSGASVEGFESSRWQLVDAAKKLYRISYKRRDDEPTESGFGLDAGPTHELLAITLPGGKALNLQRRELKPIGDAKPSRWSWKGLDETPEALPAGSFALRSAAGDDRELFLRLPESVSPKQFYSKDNNDANDARVEVSLRGLSAFRVLKKDNFALRNLVLEGFAQSAISTYGYVRPRDPLENWLLQDVVCRRNGRGARIGHLYGFTVQNSSFSDNAGKGLSTLAAEGVFDNVEVSRNGWFVDGTWDNAMKNTLFRNVRMNDNKGIAFRNDHVAENLVFENCQFNRNFADKTLVFEVAIGPITFRNCEWIENKIDPTTRELDGIISLATIHNLTFDGCRFLNNDIAAINFYPRERAHNAVEQGGDNPSNNLDRGLWSIFSNTDNFDLTLPAHSWKPISENRNLKIVNCTFEARGEKTRFIIQSYWKRGAEYERAVRDELTAYNNRFWNPDNAKTFEIAGNEWATFEQWKAQSRRANFEAGSAFGPASTTRTTFKPQPLNLAKSGTNAKPQAAGQTLTYEVENLPFTSNVPVELRSEKDAGGGNYHRIYSEQTGDRADWIEYSLDVPRAGRYYIAARYKQTSGPDEYVGYAQLSLDSRDQGAYFDQHGVTRQFMSTQLGVATLSAGTHRFRFRPVWRNGYGSASYNLTFDRITLSPTLEGIGAIKPLPASTRKGANGLRYASFGTGGNTLGDFFKSHSGTIDNFQVTPNFDTKVRPRDNNYALRFEGLLQVPADGLYTFFTRVNDGANLYLSNQLILDNDGVHDGEKNEPWEKQAVVALKKGLYPIRLDYFQASGGQHLEVSWQGPNMAKQKIEGGVLFLAAQ